jgi:ATP-binding cassette subfamily B protein
MARQGHYWRLYEAQARRAEADEDESDYDAALLASHLPQPAAHGTAA